MEFSCEWGLILGFLVVAMSIEIADLWCCFDRHMEKDWNPVLGLSQLIWFLG
jgi:hypothetical protein